MLRLILVGALALPLLTACKAPVERSDSWLAFGDEASAELYTRTVPDAEAVLEEIREYVSAFEARVDPDSPASELAALNQLAGDGFYRVQDRDLYRCLLLALDYARASRGAFDPTVGALAGSGGLEAVGWQEVLLAEEARALRFRRSGMALDLDGVAKGFALDVASRVFTRAGMVAGRLRIGGNGYVWGVPPGRDTWATEVWDPRRPETAWLTLQAANRGFAVSSTERGVVDPGTGLPPAGDVRVALAVADSGGDADALSTALLVAGSVRAGDLLGRARRVEAVLLVDGRSGPELRASGSLQGRITLSPALAAEVDGRIRYILPPERLD